jgi:aldehyde:ferredoxin oxidoreductase
MSVVDYLNHAGILPTRNFSDGYFDRAETINGFEMEERYKIGDTACFGCPMACGNINLVKEGPYAGTVVEGPEYETACMFGSNLGVDNFGFILKANALCDDLGIDTISTGNLIGVLIEGYKRGDLKARDLDGLRLEWGDEETILILIEKIARREGVGDVLADGAKRVIEKWPALKPIVSEVKGLEQSAYDGRATISMALAYATSDIGAHHARAWTVGKELEMGADWGIEEKVDLVIYHQETRPVFDMLGVCRLPWIELGFSELHYPEFYKAVTGVSMDIKEMFSRSDDLYDLTRLINVERGVTRKDDYPPARCFDLPIQTGPQAGKVVDRDEYEQMLQLYYKKRGWDENGVPPESVREHFNDKLNE